MTNRMHQYVGDIRSGADTLNSQIEGVQSQWNDVNYHCLAYGAAQSIKRSTDAFCADAGIEAHEIYLDVMRIEQLLNQM